MADFSSRLSVFRRVYDDVESVDVVLSGQTVSNKIETNKTSVKF